MTTEPFFIVPKSAHETILAKIEGTNVAFCIAVYDALRRLANGAQCADGPVTLTINQVAGQAGCSYRKAADVLNVLESLGVIGITSQRLAGTKSHAPSTYSFPTSCTMRRTLGTLCLTLGTDRTSNRAEIDKERKERKESCAESAAPPVARKRSAKPRKPRARNPLLDAIATIHGSDLAQLTSPAWSVAAKALAVVKEVCPAVTPDEIRRRIANYQLHFPAAKVSSPLALAKWWSLCDRPPSGHGTTQPDLPLRMI